jgi:8-oxo-dGTP pyrophosphatase MutT (NUDIX family)
MNPISKIHFACSLMLVNQHYEFLMLKRSPEAKFMPNFWVFGGGKVEKEDEVLWALLSNEQQDLFKETIGLKSLGLTEKDAVFLWANGMACLRETWEEASVLLPGCPSSLIDAWQNQTEISKEDRDVLFHHIIKAMHYTDHWLTPVDYPVRFDTLFFMTLVENRLESKVDGKEIVDSSWWKPSQMLQAYENHVLDLGAPTIRLLHDLAQYENQLIDTEGGKMEQIQKIIHQRKIKNLQPNHIVCPKAFRDKQNTILLFPNDQAFDQEHDLQSLLLAQTQVKDRLVLENQRLKRYID